MALLHAVRILLNNLKLPSHWSVFIFHFCFKKAEEKCMNIKSCGTLHTGQLQVPFTPERHAEKKIMYQILALSQASLVLRFCDAILKFFSALQSRQNHTVFGKPLINIDTSTASCCDSGIAGRIAWFLPQFQNALVWMGPESSACYIYGACLVL